MKLLRLLAAPLVCSALFASKSPNYDHLRQSVVRIQAVSGDFDWFHPFYPSHDGVGTGSGFVVQSDPYPLFVTNHHVIRDAKHVSLQLLLYGEQRWDARVVSECSKFDIAILVLEEPQAFDAALRSRNINLTALSVSEGVTSMGDDVVALGFPLGQDSLKISKGNVAGNEEVDGNVCIQSTAPISPGSSGGPLLNADGTAVVGVNFAKATAGENINYVIPAWRVNQMIRKHHQDQPSVSREWRRISVDVPKPELTTIQPAAALYKMGGCSSGVYVARVGERSFLRQAEPPLQARSFLVSMNGVPLDRFGMGVNPEYAADRVEYPDLMFMTRDLSSDLVFETCTKGQVTKHHVSLAYKPEFDRGIAYVDEPYIAGVSKQYEIFGGVTVMQMTVNHISYIVHNWGDPSPTRWLYPDFVAKPRLMVVNVPSGTYASEVLSEGAAVKSLNGHEVSTLEEFRQHLVPEAGDVWTLETDLGEILALEYTKTLEDQIHSSYSQSFLLTPGVQGAARRSGIAFQHLEAPAVAATAAVNTSQSQRRAEADATILSAQETMQAAQAALTEALKKRQPSQSLLAEARATQSQDVDAFAALPARATGPLAVSRLAGQRGQVTAPHLLAPRI